MTAATIVIEHSIQSSGIAHTMQLWHVYRKWNECLFTKMSQAFIDGQADKDPSTFWYQLAFSNFASFPWQRS